MVSASIFEAVKKLEAGTVKKRAEGLQDLERILNQPQPPPKLNQVHDDGWHKILDLLFELTNDDKHEILGGSATAKTRAASRLDTVATALRLVVTSCNTVIRHKTAYAVLDHISGHLKFDRDNEAPFRSKVQSEFVKTFSIILTHESHGEHLRANQWQKYLDFILDAINANISGLNDNDDDDEDAMSISRVVSTNGSVRSTVPVRTSQTSSSKGPRSPAAQLLDDFVLCLRSLSSITNCPLHSRLGHIAQTVLRTLSTSFQTKVAAFECLNNVLVIARTEEVALVSHVAAQVLVLIRQLWSHKADPKSINLREQMLITLLLVRQSLVAGLVIHSKIDQSTIESLADHMLDEYDSRTEQYCLQITDLQFFRCIPEDLFTRGGISPDLSSSTAILNWTNVSMIAHLRSLSQQYKFVGDATGDAPRPKKRPRISTTFPDLVKLLFLDDQDLDIEDALQFLEEMLPKLSDDRRGKSSWILLVVSRLCRTSLAQNPKLTPYWLRTWTAASHLISSSSNSRAACFTMMTLLDTGLVDGSLSSASTIESCFPSGSRGPPTLIDSALLLFTACLQSKLLHTERDFKDFRDKVLSWLDVVWTLPTTRDYLQCAELARNGQTNILFELCISLGGKRAAICPPSPTAHHATIYHAYARMSENAKFTDFLFGSINLSGVESCSDRKRFTSDYVHSIRAVRATPVISEFLFRKLKELRLAFREIEFSECMDKSGKQLEHKRRSNLSIDIVEIICSACATAALFSEPDYDNDEIAAAWECVSDYVKLQHDSSVFEDTCTRIVQRLLSTQSATEPERFNLARKREVLVNSMNEIIASGRVSQSSDSEMDLVFSMQPSNSQQSQGRQLKFSQGLSRRDLPTPLNDHSSFVEMKMLILWESQTAATLGSAKHNTAMIDYITTLSAHELLAASSTLLAWLNQNPSLTTQDTIRLLHRSAEVCLQADENERNEAALCFCLKMLQGTTETWVSTVDEDLAELAFDCYSWFVNIALGKSIASTKVLYHLAKLLEYLLQHRPRYGAESLPSPRTSLLQILKVAISGLRFELVPALTKLFDGYVLTEHAAIFDDIVDCLPTDPDDEEGIVVRLYILAKLGSQWRTVLRQAVYHMFETAANVPSVNSIAFKGLQMMTREVGLGRDPAKILHLFAPQLFFTWLEEGTIDTIPFTAFGYESLHQLLSDERSELVAQAALRMNSRHQQTLVSVLGPSWQELLTVHFARSQVYAIATDIVENRAGAEPGPIERELRDQLGEDKYSSLSRRYFPEAVAQIILSLSDDRGLEKVMGSANRYRSLSQTYKAIQEKGCSTITYPSRQQPSFRAKYLMQILSKLCLVAQTEPDTFWTPALLILVYRKLFDDAEPALGPLHIALIIRKIRIAVTLAGSIALRGYPLEMLLHSLRPYLTQFHCAEDTIGIYWFLLENGVAHLEKNLSFMAGLSVSIFISLSAFAMSSQESTTQESQFLSTMSKAKEFRHWLGNYLASLKTSQLPTDQASRFQKVIDCAKNVATSGSSSKHEPEGNLLYHILLDQAAADPLVSQNYFDVIMQALGKEFRTADDPSDDILIDPDDVISGVPVLWAVLGRLKLPTSFLSWTGSILGRAYLIKGPKLELKHNEYETPKLLDNESSLEATNSFRTIVRHLTDVLWNENVQAASKAEQTLSFILSSISKAERGSILRGKRKWMYLEDLVFESMYASQQLTFEAPKSKRNSLPRPEEATNSPHWAALVAERLISDDASDNFLMGLIPLLRLQHTFGENILPAIIHVVLLKQMEGTTPARDALSELFNAVLSNATNYSHEAHARLVLRILIYLRRCKIVDETTSAHRNLWLEIEFSNASSAALHCKMPHTALLMLEIDQAQQLLMGARRRRSSINTLGIDAELVSKIFQSVHDNDFFYGIHQEHDVQSVLAKLKHEGHGTQVLALQSAFFDANIKVSGSEQALRQQGRDVVASLSLANFHGLAFATQHYGGANANGQLDRQFCGSLLNIHQWDVSSSEQTSENVEVLNNVLAKIALLESKEEIKLSMSSGLHDLMKDITRHRINSAPQPSDLMNLAALGEIQRLLATNSNESLEEAWAEIIKPTVWAEKESFDSFSSILTAREAAAAAMSQNSKSRELFHANALDLLLHEIQTVRSSLHVASKHDAAQFRLNRAVYLQGLQGRAARLNLDAESAITFDIANTLWSQGEITAPIEMLRSLQSSNALGKGALPVSKAELLTDLGQKISQARLDRPDEVTKDYLQPAIQALGKTRTGSMAGRVYHNFAAFCDEQLQDSAAKDDFDRIMKIRNRKLQEMNELAEMYKNPKGGDRRAVKAHYAKAKTWFDLDDEEYRRLKTNRKQLLEKSLENYLLSMRACDDHSQDVLRLMSLWLGNSTVPEASKVVGEHLKFVPTSKLAPFVNQLSSRLLDGEDGFQQVLFDLLYRICLDHPYHSQYQLFAVCRSKGAQNDSVATSRHQSATKLSNKVHSSGGTSSAIWISVHNSAVNFVNFAQEKLSKEVKTGSKVPMKSFKHGSKLEQTMQGLSHRIPPPTMNIPLRADKDYTSIPTLTNFEPNISVAGGVSAPKIATALATDGSRHKMLLKGGNDDLRQDAIMEQVFAQVSDLLQDHRPTRQRGLGIRTYKVIPLTHNTGIIEFVQNTVPLHEYLLPAHARYFPKDFKSTSCRKAISDASSKKPEERLKAYRYVTEHFHPVMRFFFMEHFLDPDEWFEKRLNYSRSTAAISMLGHVLGLGDRHGHNILLDEQTGEVVHIDLGVAFEAGRVLPIPEVVPFRLTRDLVDGMGISGVEGPFRRCCNFTLEALRKSQDAIMTILDVLRWDPLYSWSTSPLRVQRMQDQQEREAAAAAAISSKADKSTPGPDEGADAAEKKADDGVKSKVSMNEPGEADRALAIVAKKLSASLSVEATVNELIRQATDETNLAVLYCGWAAYV